MSLHETTRREIEEILNKAFSPIFLQVIDDSALHSGHAEAVLHPKAGHFKVIMKCFQFDGQNQIKRHRMVYEQLASLMEKKIHALSLSLLASSE
jgi:BolA family transcriptional regulator, general stress-responsive regulator